MSSPTSHPLIPESLGPGTEIPGSGEVRYGSQADLPRMAPLPKPTPAERAALMESLADVIRNCPCAPIPDGVLTPLRRLAARAGTPVLSGCPRCLAMPYDVIGPLADTLEPLALTPGAPR
jgi:hypothetical protein